MKPDVRRRARAALGIVTVVGVLAGALMSAAASAPRSDDEPAADAPGAVPHVNSTARVSLSSVASAANGATSDSDLSADGRWVAFVSTSTNLVAHDTNRAADVFVRDVTRNRTTRISVGPAGRQANGASTGVSISADGRWVAFSSVASNLVAGDTNGFSDVFLHDVRTHRTTRVSVNKGGLQAAGGSSHPSLSANGRWVAFQSGAANLVGQDTNGVVDVFLHGVDGTTRRVSVGKDGTQGNGASINASVSGNGRYVAFQSGAANLIPKDTNKVNDVFVRDTGTKTTRRVSTGNGRAQLAVGSGGPAISADGRHVAFHTTIAPPAGAKAPASPAYGQVWVHDRLSGRTKLVSVPVSGGFAHAVNTAPTISRDGRRVAYTATSTTVAGQLLRNSEVFVRDVGAARTLRVGLAPDGARALGGTLSGVISDDGKHVAFESAATNLVPGDVNGVTDTFVRYLRDFGADAIRS